MDRKIVWTNADIGLQERHFAGIRPCFRSRLRLTLRGRGGNASSARFSFHTAVLRLAMNLIDSKSKSYMLDELRDQSMHPSDLHKVLPEVASRVLDMQLKALMEDGPVAKTIFSQLPPRTEYAITPLGLTLIPIIDAMLAWGKKNKDIFERKYEK